MINPHCCLRASWILLNVLLFSFAHAQTVAGLSPAAITRAKWTTETVAPGITWKYLRTGEFFNSRQSINVLDIDLSSSGYTIQFPHLEAGRIPTSRIADSIRAIAAINGTFFNMDTGGATCFLKVNDTIFSVSRYDLSGGYFLPQLDAAGLAIDRSGKPRIVYKPPYGWENLSDYPSIMVTGPILIKDGYVVEQQDIPFNASRHPRTAVGTTRDNRLILVTVDGRNEQAAGASTTELAQIMAGLGCTEAINLDGGGSTTMWIRSKGENGVVNYPSDNKQFDRRGERAVSNVIAIMPNRK
jgi:exopolysaccharide biosynthesis protein